jgi:hypothetical protein
MRRASRRFLVGLAAFLMGSFGAQAQQFHHAVYYGAGRNAFQVVCAQFSNGGNFDLAVADYPGSQVSILLGNGDGTFQKPKKFSVPSPIRMAAGDLDGDGKEDLVVVESGGTGESSLGIFLSNGNGTFRKAATYPSGIGDGGITLGDFDGDGNLDVATILYNGKQGSVVVFFGNGKGHFGRRTTYKVTGGPYDVAAGDLNSDHHPDLAVTDAFGGNVSILLNDGTGRFKKPHIYSAAGGEAHGVVIADLNRDGAPDLVIANGSAGMVVLLNNGDGTFGKPTVYPPACQNCVAPEACVVADFNLDGNLDGACATSIDDSYLFYGKGNGKFGKSIPIHDAINFQGGFSIAAGDFNNDKSPDLVIPIQIKGKVAVMLNAQ